MQLPSVTERLMIMAAPCGPATPEDSCIPLVYTLPAHREPSHPKLISTKGFADQEIRPILCGTKGQKLWQCEDGLALPVPYHNQAAQQAT